MTFNDNVRQVAALGAAGFIGAMLVIAAASPAHGKAKGPIEVIAHKAPLTTVVPYGDLSLTTREGKDLLYRRVGYAVDTVCPELDELGFSYFRQDCKDFAWDGARPQIHKAIRDAKQGNTSIAMAIQITAAR